MQAVMGLLPASLKAVDGSIELLGEDVLTASPDRIRQWLKVRTRGRINEA